MSRQKQTAGHRQRLCSVATPAPNSQPIRCWNNQCLKPPLPSKSEDLIGIAGKCNFNEMPRTVLGPRSAIKRIRDELEIGEEKRLKWFEKARCEAILGGAHGSLPSLASGVRCYLNFAEAVLKKKGPKLSPSVDELLAYSHMFRCSGTFSNYLGYLRKGCLLDGVSVEVFEHPAVRAAKKSVKKRGSFQPRAKLFVKWQIVDKILDRCITDLDFDPKYGMLFAITYCFLLRLPSEVCV